jgi:hypothetical protein
MKDNNVNKDDPDFKLALNELKLRKKALEEQVKKQRNSLINMFCFIFQD